MHIGCHRYKGPEDLPAEIPVFPLCGALLLPRGHMPLNIFEPRYVAMVDHILRCEHRLIAMVQPVGECRKGDVAELHRVACIGRLTQWSDTADGRYQINLCGVTRCELGEETTNGTLFRTFKVNTARFAEDFLPRRGETEVDRLALISALKHYLDIHGLEANWDGVGAACNEVLVNALSMMSPFGPEEKQLLLEAPDLKTRADTIIALAERDVARCQGHKGSLQ